MDANDAAQQFVLSSQNENVCAWTNLQPLWSEYAKTKNLSDKIIAQVVSALKNNEISDIWKYLNVIVCCFV